MHKMHKPPAEHPAMTPAATAIDFSEMPVDGVPKETLARPKFALIGEPRVMIGRIPCRLDVAASPSYP